MKEQEPQLQVQVWVQIYLIFFPKPDWLFSLVIPLLKQGQPLYFYFMLQVVFIWVFMVQLSFIQVLLQELYQVYQTLQALISQRVEV